MEPCLRGEYVKCKMFETWIYDSLWPGSERSTSSWRHLKQSWPVIGQEMGGELWLAERNRCIWPGCSYWPVMRATSWKNIAQPATRATYTKPSFFSKRYNLQPHIYIFISLHIANCWKFISHIRLLSRIFWRHWSFQLFVDVLWSIYTSPQYSERPLTICIHSFWWMNIHG